MDWLASPEIWMALVTLTSLEIVLGVDNIIFIAILVGRLPLEQQAKGRTIGLALAMLTRLGLLFSITLLLGMALIGEGFTLHIPKGYIYFAMAFSVFVEMLNMRLRAKKIEPLRLCKSVPIDLDVE